MLVGPAPAAVITVRAGTRLGAGLRANAGTAIVGNPTRVAELSIVTLGDRRNIAAYTNAVAYNAVGRILATLPNPAIGAFGQAAGADRGAIGGRALIVHTAW